MNRLKLYIHSSELMVIKLELSSFDKRMSTEHQNHIVIAKKVGEDLDVDIPLELTDKEMILHIADRVERLLKADPDLLMSYLYRLDVEQKKIHEALTVSILPVHVTFAELIWERQKQRIATKKKYKQDPIEGWEF